jgi:hypothetical protein
LLNWWGMVGLGVPQRKDGLQARRRCRQACPADPAAGSAPARRPALRAGISIHELAKAGAAALPLHNEMHEDPEVPQVAQGFREKLGLAVRPTRTCPPAPPASPATPAPPVRLPLRGALRRERQVGAGIARVQSRAKGTGPPPAGLHGAQATRQPR